MRILIVGSRDWLKPGIVQHELDRIASRLISSQEGRYLKEGLVLVAGASTRGVDALAKEWASRRMDTDLEQVKSSEWADVVGEHGGDACLAFISAGPEATGPTYRARVAAEHGITVERHGWRGGEGE